MSRTSRMSRMSPPVVLTLHEPDEGKASELSHHLAQLSGFLDLCIEDREHHPCAAVFSSEAEAERAFEELLSKSFINRTHDARIFPLFKWFIHPHCLEYLHTFDPFSRIFSERHMFQKYEVTIDITSTPIFLVFPRETPRDVIELACSAVTRFLSTLTLKFFQWTEVDDSMRTAIEEVAICQTVQVPNVPLVWAVCGPRDELEKVCRGVSRGEV